MILSRSLHLWPVLLVRFRWLLLAFGLLSLPCLFQAQRELAMDRTLASLFPDGDADLLHYQKLQADFGGNAVVMLVYQDARLFSEKGLAANREWSQRVEAIQGVQGVLSLSKLEDAFLYLRPPLPFVTPAGTPLLQEDDPLAAEFLELFQGYTHSQDLQTGVVVAMLDPGQTNQAVGEISRLAERMPTDWSPMMVGEPVLLRDAFDLIQADGQRLAISTVALLSLVILLLVRDYRVVLVAVLALAWAVLATRGAMVLLGIPLTLVSSILTAIVTVIVVASLLHVAIMIRSTRVQRLALRTRQIRSVLSVLLLPVIVTCATDAAGFAALMTSQIVPVIQFGLVVALASLLVLVALGLFVPSIFSLPEFTFGAAAPISDTYSKQLRWLVSICIAQRRWLVVLAMIATLVCGIVVLGLETKTSFLDNFRPDSHIVRSYEAVESRLGGAGVWDVVLPAPDVIDADYLSRVVALEEKLRSIRVVASSSADGSEERIGLSKVLSLADADVVARKAPVLAISTPEVRLAGMRLAIPSFADALLTPAGSERPRHLRIMLRSPENLPAIAKRRLIMEVNDAVQSWERVGALDSERPSTGLGVMPYMTGYYVLMTDLVSSLVADQWRTLLVAVSVIGVLLWIACGDLRVALVALWVNVTPVLVVLALTGIGKGQLDLGSAMIGAVSIGLSIDGSVHYLSQFGRLRQTGCGVEWAAVDAAVALSKPLMAATIALVVGFGVLLSSPFVPTATFGTLISATLLSGSLINLLLLPGMLVMVLQPRNASDDNPDAIARLSGRNRG